MQIYNYYEKGHRYPLISYNDRRNRSPKTGYFMAGHILEEDHHNPRDDHILDTKDKNSELPETFP